MVRDATYEIAQETDVLWMGESLRVSDKKHNIQDICFMRGLDDNPTFSSTVEKLESEIRTAFSESPFSDRQLHIVRRRVELWNKMISAMEDSLHGQKTFKLTLHDGHLAIIFTHEPAIMVEDDISLDAPHGSGRVTQSVDTDGVVSIGDNYGTTAVFVVDERRH